jgi:hypothetical protein
MTGGMRPPAADVPLFLSGSAAGLPIVKGKGEQMRTCVVCGGEFAYEPKPGRPPVTCSPECQREHKARRGATRKCPPDKHGTATGYSWYKCDCAKCRHWARDYQRTRRSATRSDTTKTRRTTGRSEAKRSRTRRHDRDAAIAELVARGWSYRRIAERLGCSVGSVHNAIKRAEMNTPDHN